MEGKCKGRRGGEVGVGVGGRTVGAEETKVRWEETMVQVLSDQTEFI